MATDPITLRPAQPDDLPFILDSWLHSARKSPEHRLLAEDVYYPRTEQRIRGLLAHSRALVACSADDAAQLFGYAVAEPGTLHYVYVKHAFRRHGIALRLVRALLPEFGGEAVTAVTSMCSDLSRDCTFVDLAHRFKLRLLRRQAWTYAPRGTEKRP